MQPIKIMSWPSRRKRKWNQFSQFSWGSTKEIPIEKILASYILTMSQGFKRNSNCWTSSPTYPFLKLIQHIHLAARSTSPDMTTVFHARRCGRFIAINSNLRKKKPHRKNECPKCLCNRDNKGGPIQFQREKDPQNLKRWFFVKIRPIYCHINSTTVIHWVKWNQVSFSSIEINKPLSILVCSAP